MASLLLGLAASVLAQTAQTPDFRLPTDTFFKKEDANPDGRRVFAWFMVCCGPFNGGWEKADVKEYVQDIQMAQSMGIDGFGLEATALGKNDLTLTSIEKMFQAAKQAGGGFKLFFVFDGGEQTEFTRCAVDLLKKYSHHECYQLVDKLPLVSSYDRISFNIIDPLRKAGLEIFYVPDVWDAIQTGNTYLGNPVQGMSRWEIQTSPIGGGVRVLERQATAVHNAKKAWMSTVALHYWVGSVWSVPHWDWIAGQPPKAGSRNGTYFEHAGGKGLDEQWRSVINVQKAEWVMMLTWNDYNESYIEPVDDYKKYFNGTPQAPLGWYKSQAGLDELNRYYIQWYKTGTPPQITRDSLFYVYRTSSQKLVATKDPRPPVNIGNGPIGDDIYITTALTAPARLQVISGSSKSTFDLPAGINHTVTPFAAGAQSFSLWRNGAQIVGAEGEPVVSSIEYYNYRPTTGCAMAKGNH
jgi:glucan endo-1,3-alpha-glucosidase